MSKTSLKTTVEWHKINWRKLERRVYKLQKRIYQASKRGDVKTFRRLQKLLMKSWYAKALAVRRVTQDNQGKKTAGVDGVKSLTPKQRLELIDKMQLGTKVKPTRRVWIPKPGKDEKRHGSRYNGGNPNGHLLQVGIAAQRSVLRNALPPLGIPTMNDRALQALVKMALEPEWEARFEPNSYGFRPGRSCHDAVEAIFRSIKQKPKFVLDADIAQCFDRINHKALLRKLNTFPSLRRQIRAWLKAGVIDSEQLFPTFVDAAAASRRVGTPQGGVISPLLANIALHGMEERIKQFAETLDMKNTYGRQQSKRDKRCSLSIIRYADDFVILHEDITVVQRCREIISEWLHDMGLELKPSKTRLTHTLNKYQGEEPGFDFLGFNIRQFAVGRTQSKLGFKTIIIPSKEKQKVHYDQIASIIKSHKSAPQEALINKLNPIIRGWANYYATVVSKDTYSEIDNLMYLQLRAWANRRHPKKSAEWVLKKYWLPIGSFSWVFATKKEEEYCRLLRHDSTPIVRHVKVQGEASPYDGNLVYWSTRMGNSPEMPTRITKLLKKQKGKCAHCELYFRESDVLEIDHIIPKSQGGKDDYNNCQLLHRHCHDTKTANDGNLRCV